MGRLPKSAILLSCLFGVFGSVGAEKHTIRFENHCGYGTPHLLKDGKVLSQGEEFISEGAFTSGIAYLQTGNCNLNGEGCTLVEMTLINPKCPGCGSSADISLIPPLAYSVPTSFKYSNGCDGDGAACSSSDCRTAFAVPDDNEVQVQCQENDVDLLISFCHEGSGPLPTGTAVLVPNATPSITMSWPRSKATPLETMSSSQPHTTHSKSTSGFQYNISPPAPIATRPSTITSQHEQATVGTSIFNSEAQLTPGERRCSNTHAERRLIRNYASGVHRRLNRQAVRRSGR